MSVEEIKQGSENLKTLHESLSKLLQKSRQYKVSIEQFGSAAGSISEAFHALLSEQGHDEVAVTQEEIHKDVKLQADLLLVQLKEEIEEPLSEWMQTHKELYARIKSQKKLADREIHYVNKLQKLNGNKEKLQKQGKPVSQKKEDRLARNEDKLQGARTSLFEASESLSKDLKATWEQRFALTKTLFVKFQEIEKKFATKIHAAFHHSLPEIQVPDHTDQIKEPANQDLEQVERHEEEIHEDEKQEDTSSPGFQDVKSPPSRDRGSL